MAFFYINSSSKRIQFTTAINLCESQGMMSVCRAATEEDQKGCKYREDSPQIHIKRCMYYCESMNGACDNMWAQRNIEKPK